MNGVPRQVLCGLIATYGWSLCDDPRRCEALLRDHCSQYRREIIVLVSALKEGVAAELLTSATGLPKEMVLLRLAKRLQDNLALAEEAARWAVESWALALGVISTAEIVTYSKKSRANVQVEPSTASEKELIAGPTAAPQSISAAGGGRSDVAMSQSVSTRQGQSSTQISTNPAAVQQAALVAPQPGSSSAQAPASPAMPATPAFFPVKGYASVLRRGIAYCIDILILIFYIFYYRVISHRIPIDNTIVKMIPEIQIILFAWLYYAILECSAIQGTLGKAIVRIKVTDMQGLRASFIKITCRFFAKILFLVVGCIVLIELLSMIQGYYPNNSFEIIKMTDFMILPTLLLFWDDFPQEMRMIMLIFIIPFLIITLLSIKFTEKSQTIYDKIAGCLVLNK